MIRYRDGSALAQLGQPDMRTPDRLLSRLGPSAVDAGVAPLDLVGTRRGWISKRPIWTAFPCLALAQRAITQPGGMCVYSAANEVAVAAFLAGEMRFHGDRRGDCSRTLQRTVEFSGTRESRCGPSAGSGGALTAAGQQVAQIVSLNAHQEKEL